MIRKCFCRKYYNIGFFLLKIVNGKRKEKEYLLCKGCLMQNHDVAIYKKPGKCPICGSERIKIVCHENFY